VKHANADGATILHCLARNTYSEELKALLDFVMELGAEKEAKDKFGESPLQRSCAALNLEMASWFLSKDVDINSTNQYDFSSTDRVHC
jgi:ankyrin repeat protein